MAVEVRVYYDFASPFCYVARAVLARLGRSHDIRVDWQPFEVIDYLPPQGAMPQNPAFVRRAQARDAARLARVYGLEVHLRDRLLNSNLALCTVEHARVVAAMQSDAGMLDAVHAALFEAFYRDQRDIGKVENVLDMARTAGLQHGLAEALADGRYREVVARSRRDAHALGVVSVPLFLAHGYAVGGIPEFAAFKQLIAQAAAPRHTPEGQL
ncbi:MAG TPA: DsbA family protein [Chloroflexota bacterium]|nr:DsbA family protein [Chloroflexota bacterium]